MAQKSCSGARQLIIILLLTTWQAFTEGTKPSARKEDVPLIKCAVCKEIAANTFKQVEALRAKATKAKKVTEMMILGITEKICKPNRDQGDWIQWLDIVEAGSTLELKRQKYKGECLEECKTIEKGCEEIMGFADTDVAEVLFTRPELTLKQFEEKLCKEITSSCKGPLPKVPKGRKPGPAFVRKTQKEIEREEMLRNIEGKQELYAEEHPDAPRMPKMKLYSRDDIMKKTAMPGMQGEGEEDDDDEDEDEEGEEGSTEETAQQGTFRSKDPKSNPETDELRTIAAAMREAELAKEGGSKADGVSQDAQPSSWWDRTRSHVVATATRMTSGVRQLIEKYSQALTRDGKATKRPARDDEL